ncbi:M48 family metallopeptidase [Candidatus Desantisbacteria bacterium]|nr:M48 family metallopeptidase [Candidatus Desantisbacteria bacterium]
MNIYFYIILISLVGIHILDSLSLWMNLSFLSPDLPEEFKDVYSRSEYMRSQKYTREQTLFEIISSTFDLFILLIFWFLGGFNSLDIWIRNSGYHPIINGLLYAGILIIAKQIITLPFDIYSTFVIEEKFGFNKTTVRTFILDRIKMLLLSSILGGLILVSLLFFFEWAGAFAWLYGWGFVTVFTIILQFIAPTYILPIFNKFTPLADGELKTSIMHYADSVQFPLQGLFVMDGSKRSSKSNAFFTGFGKNKRIALFDTLISKHTTGELVSILAHEIGHYKKKHVQKNIIISIAEMGIFFFLLSFFISQPKIFDAFFIKNISTYAGLLLFMMLYTPISFILSILTQILSRLHEYEADNFAAQTTNDSQALINSLKQLAVTNLSNLTPHPFYVFLHYSHPPLLQRILNLRKYGTGIKT